MSENNSLCHPKEVEVFLVKRRPSLVIGPFKNFLRVFTQNVVSQLFSRSDISRFTRTKNLGTLRRFDTKARHPRRPPTREKTNAQKKRPHGNASGCLKKGKSTEPWRKACRSPRRARSARERRRCREHIVHCRKGIINIVVWR